MLNCDYLTAQSRHGLLLANICPIWQKHTFSGQGQVPDLLSDSNFDSVTWWDKALSGAVIWSIKVRLHIVLRGNRWLSVERSRQDLIYIKYNPNWSTYPIKDNFVFFTISVPNILLFLVKGHLQKKKRQKEWHRAKREGGVES